MKTEEELNLTEEINLLHAGVTQQGRSPVSQNGVVVFISGFLHPAKPPLLMPASWTHHLSFPLFNVNSAPPGQLTFLCRSICASQLSTNSFPNWKMLSHSSLFFLGYYSGPNPPEMGMGWKTLIPSFFFFPILLLSLCNQLLFPNRRLPWYQLLSRRQKSVALKQTPKCFMDYWRDRWSWSDLGWVPPALWRVFSGCGGAQCCCPAAGVQMQTVLSKCV